MNENWALAGEVASLATQSCVIVSVAGPVRPCPASLPGYHAGITFLFLSSAQRMPQAAVGLEDPSIPHVDLSGQVKRGIDTYFQVEEWTHKEGQHEHVWFED
ncbi:hypothetical protein U9M48_020484 [Paspalum notatum var. saurae]|uniref:Uncharacterized protein n=1 Tax=Paspalum notatum var. saurae TaxID=547442 RepID=A0AAQ3TIA3_PASNO